MDATVDVCSGSVMYMSHVDVHVGSADYRLFFKFFYSLWTISKFTVIIQKYIMFFMIRRVGKYELDRHMSANHRLVYITVPKVRQRTKMSVSVPSGISFICIWWNMSIFFILLCIFFFIPYCRNSVRCPPKQTPNYLNNIWYIYIYIVIGTK